MNSNEILNKYINLIDKGYCSDCNELNCIDNFPHSKITHTIRELQQENKQLKDNWNKLKEIVKSQSDFKLKVRNKEVWFEIDELLSKMEELEKGVNNELR